MRTALARLSTRRVCASFFKVTERNVKFKNQILLTNTRRWTYWLAQFTTDILFYTVLVAVVYVGMVVATEGSSSCQAG